MAEQEWREESGIRATTRRRIVVIAVAIAAIMLGARGWHAVRRTLLAGPRTSSVLDAPTRVKRDSTPANALPTLALADSLRGHSNVLRFVTLTPEQAATLPGFISRFGERAIHVPDVYKVLSAPADTMALITLAPFADKHGGYVGSYRLGVWPAEQWLLGKNYFNPDGFVEVTPDNAALRVSPHFQLGDFITHDQDAVWPKYVVLEGKLIDKLELVLADLGAHGVDVHHVVVLSGFRAPYYNARGVSDGEGMARTSRHQYGDAADIIIDANGDGSMDDLNHDGHVDLRDVVPIEQATARVEARYPDLVGGLGTYSAMGPRGPFAHIDVRGTSARWERARSGGRGPAAPRDSTTDTHGGPRRGH